MIYVRPWWGTLKEALAELGKFIKLGGKDASWNFCMEIDLGFHLAAADKEDLLEMNAHWLRKVSMILRTSISLHPSLVLPCFSTSNAFSFNIALLSMRKLTPSLN